MQWSNLIKFGLLATVAVLAGLPTVRGNHQVVFIAGGSQGWQGWSSMVDGVMGGHSSGRLMMNYHDPSAMVFAGVIDMMGGGFSRAYTNFKNMALNFKGYGGLAVAIDSLPENRLPLALQLQLGNVGNRFSFASTFTLRPGPPGSTQTFFLPFYSFDNATSMNHRCDPKKDNCEFDKTIVDHMSLNVLFQPGPFVIRMRGIAAVKSHKSVPFMSKYPIAISGPQPAAGLLMGSMNRGAGLFDNGYVELSSSLYSATLETLAVSQGPPEFIKSIVCTGLLHSHNVPTSLPWPKEEIQTWILLRTMLTVKAVITNGNLPDENSYPSFARGNFLSTNNTKACARYMMVSSPCAKSKKYKMLQQRKNIMMEEQIEDTMSGEQSENIKKSEQVKDTMIDQQVENIMTKEQAKDTVVDQQVENIMTKEQTKDTVVDQQRATEDMMKNQKVRLILG